MKKLFSAFAAILIIAVSHGQYSYEIINSQQVGKSFGPIATDNTGNTIITGPLTTTLTLGGITLNNNSGRNQAYVAKRLANGSFAWAKKFNPLSIPGGTSYSDITGVNTDATGNVYVTGNFSGKMGFDNITLTSIKNGSTYTGDIFTVKMSPTGAVVWAKSAGTANNGCNAGESGRSVTADNAGNVYVTGEIVFKVFKNTTVCNELPGSTCTNATSKSITAPYVVKYNSAGTKIWERIYGNNGALAGTSCWVNHPGGLDIRTDGTNIYVTGYFHGTVTFGNVTLSTGSETITNLFLLKLDGNGNTTWARSVTGSDNNGYSVGDGLLGDGNDIYIRGVFQPGSISLGGCSLADVTARGYLAKYSSAGTCQWAIIPFGIPYGVVKIPNGNLAMLLRISSAIGWGYGIKELSPADGSTVDYIYPAIADTATADVSGYPTIARMPDGFIFSQQLAGTYHFGTLVVTSSYPKGGSQDMIIIRYTAPAPPFARSENKTSEPLSVKITEPLPGMILYPNPASNQITIQNNNHKMLGTVSIYDLSGKMIYKNSVGSSQTTIDLENFSQGVYYVRSDQLQTTIKFVKQ